jgi:hypothetical protein
MEINKMIKDIKFMHLNAGDKFMYNNTQLERIPDERVSCCKILNCKNIQTQEKLQMMPLTVVHIEVPDSEENNK